MTKSAFSRWLWLHAWNPLSWKSVLLKTENIIRGCILVTWLSSSRITDIIILIFRSFWQYWRISNLYPATVNQCLQCNPFAIFIFIALFLRPSQQSRLITRVSYEFHSSGPGLPHKSTRLRADIMADVPTPFFQTFCWSSMAKCWQFEKISISWDMMSSSLVPYQYFLNMVETDSSRTW
jgi:hypothetical protein